MHLVATTCKQLPELGSSIIHFEMNNVVECRKIPRPYAKSKAKLLIRSHNEEHAIS